MKIFRSELDENQIQQLFQQLIQRLIFYISLNSKQIITKLTIGVRTKFLKNFFSKILFYLVRSFNFKYDTR